MAAAMARRSVMAGLRSRFFSSSTSDNRSAAFRRVDRQFVADVLEQSRGDEKHDIVHMRIMRNNSFVTVTDSKGNKKFGASAGSLGQGKSSRYACDATAEHVARTAVNLGPAVIKINGLAFFKKKKEAVLGWKEGSSYADQSRILQLQDVTRLAHNGCRRRKQRRI
ncbi:ribosomal L18p/L5e family protein [Wolffia australiana]